MPEIYGVTVDTACFRELVDKSRERENRQKPALLLFRLFPMCFLRCDSGTKKATLMGGFSLVFSDV